MILVAWLSSRMMGSCKYTPHLGHRHLPVKWLRATFGNFRESTGYENVIPGYPLKRPLVTLHLHHPEHSTPQQRAQDVKIKKNINPKKIPQLSLIMLK